MKYINYIFKSPLLLILGIYILYTKFFKGESKEDLTIVDNAIVNLDKAIDQFGTNESLIFTTLSSLSKDNLELLFEKFGTRNYLSVTGRYALSGSTTGVKTLDLRQLLIEELDKTELAKLKVVLAQQEFTF